MVPTGKFYGDGSVYVQLLVPLAEDDVKGPGLQKPWMLWVCRRHGSFGAGGLVGLVHGLVWIYLDGRSFERTVDCVNSFSLN